MSGLFESYAPCHRCLTMRPRSSLLAGACNDGFCARVFEVTNAAESHRAWWLGRYPFTAFLSDDIYQEASLAAWRASEVFDSKRGVRFGTYAFGKMLSAVRQLVRRQFFYQPRRLGDVYEQLRLECPNAPADRPTLLREAARELSSAYELRGASGQAIPMLVMLEMGESQSEAARSVGVSRQYASQVRQRYGADLDDAA